MKVQYCIQRNHITKTMKAPATTPAGYFDSMIVSVSAFQLYCNEIFFLNTKGIYRPIPGSDPTSNTFEEKNAQIKYTKFFVKSYMKDEPPICRFISNVPLPSDCLFLVSIFFIFFSSRRAFNLMMSQFSTFWTTSLIRNSL